jgi:hypothetical protein
MIVKMILMERAFQINLFRKNRRSHLIIVNATALMWQQEGSDIHLNYDSARVEIKELNHKNYTSFRN